MESACWSSLSDITPLLSLSTLQNRDRVSCGVKAHEKLAGRARTCDPVTVLRQLRLVLPRDLSLFSRVTRRPLPNAPGPPRRARSAVLPRPGLKSTRTGFSPVHRQEEILAIGEVTPRARVTQVSVIHSPGGRPWTKGSGNGSPAQRPPCPGFLPGRWHVHSSGAESAFLVTYSPHRPEQPEPALHCGHVAGGGACRPSPGSPQQVPNLGRAGARGEPRGGGAGHGTRGRDRTWG